MSRMRHKIACVILEPEIADLKNFLESISCVHETDKQVILLCTSSKACSLAESINWSSYKTMYFSDSHAHLERINAFDTSTHEYELVLKTFFCDYVNKTKPNNQSRAELGYISTFSYYIINIIRQAHLCSEALSKLIDQKDLVYILDKRCRSGATLNNGISTSFARLIYCLVIKQRGFMVKQYLFNGGKTGLVVDIMKRLRLDLKNLITFVGILKFGRSNLINHLAIGTGIRGDIAASATICIDYDGTSLESEKNRHSPNHSFIIYSSRSPLYISKKEWLEQNSMELYRNIVSYSPKNRNIDFFNRQIINQNTKLLCKLAAYYQQYYLKQSIATSLFTRYSLLRKQGSVYLSDQLSILSARILHLLECFNIDPILTGHSRARREQKLRLLIGYLRSCAIVSCDEPHFHDGVTTLEGSINRSTDDFRPGSKIVLCYYSYASYKWHTQKYSPSLLRQTLESIFEITKELGLEFRVSRKKGSEPTISFNDIGMSRQAYLPLCNSRQKYPIQFEAERIIIMAIIHFGMAHYQKIQEGYIALYLHPEVESLPSDVFYVKLDELLENPGIDKRLVLLKEQVFNEENVALVEYLKSFNTVAVYK